jgi:hypothetical protein
MTIAEDNSMFSWRIGVIEAHAREIERCAHLFDELKVYDTALDKLSLRQSAANLRSAADRLEKIERELKGPASAFPEMIAAE